MEFASIPRVPEFRRIPLLVVREGRSPFHSMHLNREFSKSRAARDLAASLVIELHVFQVLNTLCRFSRHGAEAARLVHEPVLNS